MRWTSINMRKDGLNIMTERRTLPFNDIGLRRTKVGRTIERRTRDQSQIVDKIMILFLMQGAPNRIN